MDLYVMPMTSVQYLNRKSKHPLHFPDYQVPQEMPISFHHPKQLQYGMQSEMVDSAREKSATSTPHCPHAISMPRQVACHLDDSNHPEGMKSVGEPSMRHPSGWWANVHLELLQMLLPGMVPQG
mmetsp:Transcript_77744/g.137777  ORF Transcript_77744/g.137777 Transcript_77744/m.137777 type:complete len:124 (-) Transcript_77744:532-903(-)